MNLIMCLKLMETFVLLGMDSPILSFRNKTLSHAVESTYQAEEAFNAVGPFLSMLASWFVKVILAFDSSTGQQELNETIGNTTDDSFHFAGWLSVSEVLVCYEYHRGKKTFFYVFNVFLFQRFFIIKNVGAIFIFCIFSLS